MWCDHDFFSSLICELKKDLTKNVMGMKETWGRWAAVDLHVTVFLIINDVCSLRLCSCGQKNLPKKKKLSNLNGYSCSILLSDV